MSYAAVYSVVPSEDAHQVNTIDLDYEGTLNNGVRSLERIHCRLR